MTKHIVLVLAGLIFVACSRGDRSAEANQIKTGLPLYANRVVQHFSDVSKNDTLHVTVNGESLLTGTVYLKITDSAGRVIYRDGFPSIELINHKGLIDPGKDEEHIRNRIDAFFDSTHFSDAGGAFSEQVTLPDSVKMAWEAAKSDSKTTFFSYRFNKDSSKRIVYSKSLGRVIAITYQNLLSSDH